MNINYIIIEYSLNMISGMLKKRQVQGCGSAVEHLPNLSKTSV